MLKHKLFHFIISFECFTGHFGILDDYDGDLATDGVERNAKGIWMVWQHPKMVIRDNSYTLFLCFSYSEQSNIIKLNFKIQNEMKTALFILTFFIHIYDFIYIFAFYSTSTS